MIDVTASLARRLGGYRDHMERYLATDGEDGYFFDVSESRPFKGRKYTPSLILRTVGRKSGKIYLNPLIYTPYGHEYVIVGSKGGHDEHPAWFVNLVERPEVEWQVRGERFSGGWTLLEGERRAKLWPYIVEGFPNYQAYQDRTERELPVVLLTPVSTIAEKWEPPLP